MQSSNLSEALATFQLDASTILEKSAITMKNSFLCLSSDHSKVRRTNRALKSSLSLTCETNINSTIYLYDLPEWKSYMVH